MTCDKIRYFIERSIRLLKQKPSKNLCSKPNLLGLSADELMAFALDTPDVIGKIVRQLTDLKGERRRQEAENTWLRLLSSIKH